MVTVAQIASVERVNAPKLEARIMQRRITPILLMAAIVLTLGTVTNAHRSDSLLQRGEQKELNQLAQRYPLRNRTSNFFARSKISNTQIKSNRGSY